MAGMNAPPSPWENTDGDDLLELLRELGIDISEIDAGTVSASDELGNPTYPTLADVPTNLPEGTQVYVEDENQLYVEDGT